jgi:hypothetical protein
MLVFHGVRDAADLHPDAVRGLFDHGDVLFTGRIDGVLDKKGHGLAAADELPPAGEEDFDDVAAESALVDLESLKDVGHVDFSFAVFIIS